MKARTILIVGFLLLSLSLALAACSSSATPCPDCPVVEEKPCPTAAPCPECPTCEEPVVKDVPFQEAWVNSGHNDSASETFRHWDGDEPAEVSTSCAKCHSSQGYLDFLGADGSEAGKVDAAVPAVDVTGITCAACHNAVTATLNSVKFPYTVTDEAGNKVQAEITDLGAEARCMNCHQGRASKSSVDDLIARFKIEDVDAVVAPITDDQGSTVRFGFINVHYYAAAATLYGSEVKGGYEYEGKMYDAKNDHVEGFSTCIGCHDSHSLELKVEECAVCHGEDAKTEEGRQAIREVSSMMDYDGDGDVEEGMYYEIAGMQEKLYAAILEYAKSVAGKGIVYDSASHPYFFVDEDGDGVVDQNADGASVRYDAFTARLMKAAYNYQVSLKDPGAFAHGNKYIVELLYDSIEDLNAKLGTIDMTGMHRDDAGHFAGNTEAFRHWDEEGAVPGSCARCHSATGLPQFLTEGANLSNPTSNGFACTTCHDEENWPARYAVTSVTFPSGKSVTFSTTDADGKLVANDANLCLECHQGRSSKKAVDTAITGSGAADADSPAAEGKRLGFSNIHYFAAGATLFGTEVQGAYEYEGKTYAGAHPHTTAGFTCTSCHDVHELGVKVAACAGCHGTFAELTDIRYMTNQVDGDGDGDVTDGVGNEIETLAAALLVELETYSETTIGDKVSYNSHAYPYFFGSDGKGYAKWTPRLLKAAYNYQYAQKDPGAFAHNSKYVIQILIDSIEDLGGDVTVYTRP